MYFPLLDVNSIQPTLGSNTVLHTHELNLMLMSKNNRFSWPSSSLGSASEARPSNKRRNGTRSVTIKCKYFFQLWINELIKVKVTIFFEKPFTVFEMVLLKIETS